MHNFLSHFADEWNESKTFVMMNVRTLNKTNFQVRARQVDRNFLTEAKSGNRHPPLTLVLS